MFLKVGSACSIRKDHKILSLSGVTTGIFDSLHLLNDPNLVAISSFYYTSKKNIRKVGGGLFLSKKEIRKLKPNAIFYDESLELKKKLGNFDIKSLIEIKSRGLDPLEVIANNISAIKKVTYNCNSRIRKVIEEALKLKKVLLEKNWQKCMLVFVGKIQKEKTPELLMIQDGITKFLLKNEKIKTYSSDLAYVSWSEKKLKEYKSCTWLGISEIKKYDCSKEKIASNKINLSCPNGLVPGFGQLQMLKFMSKSL